MNKQQIFIIYWAHGWDKIIHPKDYTHIRFWSEFDKITVYENNGHGETISFDDVKLILRPFSDMTVEEKSKYWDIANCQGISMCEAIVAQTASEVTTYLLSIGIDLFGAIEQGFAINQKELK